MPNHDVLIVGAGLAGLTCARHLHRAGLTPRILDAEDDIGGRVRTDAADGFLFDRGFQVLLTAYPETRAQLDYDALDLGSYYDGALIRFDGRFHRLADPFRHPLDTPGTILSPIGTFTDKLRVAGVRGAVTGGRLSSLFEREECTTEAALRERYRFSDKMIDRFFRPFFGGIFFDRDLQASSRMFEFVFRMFSKGRAALPREGIGALPRQIAADLPPESIRLQAEVKAVTPTHVTLSSGETLAAEAVVVATDAPAAHRLLGQIEPTAYRSTTCLYYAADASPLEDPILVLNGDGTGPINNLSVLSDVSPGYAPPGQALISVVVLGLPDTPDEALEARVRRQLADWYGPDVGTWRHLRTVRVRYALPEQAPPYLSPPEKPVTFEPGLYVCGDHRETASLHGAMRSGRRAAEALLADRG